jgi:leucine efflux protein
MQTFHHLGDFLLAVLIFQMIPGPGTLNILRSTADHGLEAGFAAVAGTLLGGIFCMLAAAGGLEAMLQGQPAVIEALKVAGSSISTHWACARCDHAV